jgi:hypothetical protein
VLDGPIRDCRNYPRTLTLTNRYRRARPSSAGCGHQRHGGARPGRPARTIRAAGRRRTGLTRPSGVPLVDWLPLGGCGDRPASRRQPDPAEVSPRRRSPAAGASPCVQRADADLARRHVELDLCAVPGSDPAAARRPAGGLDPPCRTHQLVDHDGQPGRYCRTSCPEPLLGCRQMTTPRVRRDVRRLAAVTPIQVGNDVA